MPINPKPLRPGGASFGDVAEALPKQLADRTLRYTLKYLVDKGRLIKKGEGRWTGYHMPAPAPAAEAKAAAEAAVAAPETKVAVPLSAASQETRIYKRDFILAKDEVFTFQTFVLWMASRCRLAFTKLPLVRATHTSSRKPNTFPNWEMKPLSPLEVQLA